MTNWEVWVGWQAIEVGVLKQYTKSVHQLLLIKLEGAVKKSSATFNSGPCALMEGKQMKSIDDTSLIDSHPRRQK